MLLGAFIIGFFFGSSSNKTVVVKTEKVEVPLMTSTLEKEQIKNKEDIQMRRSHIEIDELSRPGPVRALKTRERSGSLSNDAKLSMAEEKLNFDHLGRSEHDEKDDFQMITGIGPFIEDKLNAIGIFKFSQIANMTENDIETVTSLIDFFPGRIHRDDWKGQAAKLVEKQNAAVK